MADIQQLESALVKADAAGNADDARALAAEIRRMRSAAPVEQPKQTSFIDGAKQAAGDLTAGLVRGAGSIGSTILLPADMINQKLRGEDFFSLKDNQERRRQIDEGLGILGAETDSGMYATGKIAGEIAGTAGAGGVVAKGAQAAGAAPSLVNAIATSGMRAGSNPGVLNMLTRMTGGAIAGGASAGMVDPDLAGGGAVIGGALPPTLAATGKVARTIGNTLRGPSVPQAVQSGVQSARSAGYVIPPTQANPTFANRVIEGVAGKASTAQNASARNQEVTNELVKRAIGTADLTPQGLQAVRDAANSQYDQLAQVGSFVPDQQFVNALQKSAGSKALPGITNKEVDDLVNVLGQQGAFDAQQTIESIKRLRFDGSANRVAQDPTKKALGKAQMGIANALEELVDRNLASTGQQELLTNYRAARQTLAKVYDVEKAVNQATGNIDANKLASLLKKGRPLTGELRTVAEFAQQFPKAAQSVEKMGSLPQFSPLDFGALGTLSAVTSNPLLMAGVAARPAMRSLALSAPVQNRLGTQATQNRLATLLASPDVQQQVYRSAPVAISR
jgi:hypothetical protein